MRSSRGACLTLSQPYLALLIVLLLPAMLIDIRRHRIPNWLTLPAWVIGIGLHAILGGWDGFLEGGAGWLLMFGLMFPFFILGWMGAGDVKLMAGVGAIVGWGLALQVAAGIVLTGMLISLLILARKRLLVGAMTRFWHMFGISAAARSPIWVETPEAEQQLVLPYGVPIAVGTFLSLLVMHYFF
jgi:prepilin peptidase CpaA